MKDLGYLQELAQRYGKGYDYVFFMEDRIAYAFPMNSMPCVPAMIHDESIEATVSGLAGFGKSVRVVSCVDDGGSYVLPDIIDLDENERYDY